jgi:hypothetical protein
MFTGDEIVVVRAAKAWDSPLGLAQKLTVALSANDADGGSKSG